MACGVCGKDGHNVKTCLHSIKRVAVGKDYKKSSRCECCGQYGYYIERHHTKGRGDDSDFLDVCRDCHLECCHGGNFQYKAIKPRNCYVLGGTSYWRS